MVKFNALGRSPHLVSTIGISPPVVSHGQFAGNVLQRPLVHPMPLRRGLLRQRVPEEPEVVTAIVAGAVRPGIGRVVHFAQVKCPDLVLVA